MNKTGKYFFLFCLFVAITTRAQKTEIDSLQERLKATSDKTSRLELLNLLAEASKNENPEKCLDFSYQAIELGNSLKNKKEIARAYNNLGNLYTNQGYFKKAYELYSQSLNLRIEANDQKGIAACYNNMAGLYTEQKDFRNALKYYEKSLEIRRKLKDERAVAASLNNIGSVYYREGELNKALDYFFQSLAIKSKIGDKETVGYNYNNIGNIYADLGETDKSLAYFFKALENWKEINDKTSEAVCKMGIANIYYEKGDFSMAEKFAIDALKESSEIHSVSTMADAYGMLSQIYAGMGKYKEAYTASENTNQLRDTLFANSSLKAMREGELKSDLAKRENAIALLNKDREIQKLQIARNRTWIFVLVFGLLLIGLTLAVIISRYRVKQQSNILLTKKNKEIEEQKKDITDSINYAKRIQEAILPAKEIKYRAFPDAFVLFLPKDIVSGDFYWFTEKNGKRLIAAVDCTGHGVPGAFMSMIGNAFLNEIINEKGITKPAAILDQLRINIIKSLKQSGVQGENKDGMDIAILSLEEDENGLFAEYAGANNPLWKFKKNGDSFVFEEIKADKQPIGFSGGQAAPFSNHRLQVHRGDSLYIFTDGYADQFGGPKSKKFKYKQLQDLLLSIQSEKMLEQEEILLKTFSEWKGNLEQVDDVCVIGIRI